MKEAADALAMLAAGDEAHVHSSVAGSAASAAFASHGRPPAGPHPGPVPAFEAPPPKRRGPLIAAGGAVLGLEVATGIVFFVKSGADETQAADIATPTAQPTTAAEAPSTENVAETPSAGGGDLVVPASGTWILVLESMAQNEKSLAEAQALASQLAVPGYDVVVVDSSTTRA